MKKLTAKDLAAGQEVTVIQTQTYERIVAHGFRRRERALAVLRAAGLTPVQGIVVDIKVLEAAAGAVQRIVDRMLTAPEEPTDQVGPISYDPMAED